MESPLQRWLGDDLPVERFAREVMGRQPFARPAAAADAMPCLQWETLGRLLPREDLDVLVVRGGREHDDVPRPRDLEGLRALLDRGLGLVVRRAERRDPGLATLGSALGRELGGRAVHVQLFVTAGETNGFGWHYDAEEVFIVQTEGTKDYYFRENTVSPPGGAGAGGRAGDAQPTFERVREERSPVMTATLVAGDWLHLPRGWWHVAKARSDSLSISLGVGR